MLTLTEINYIREQVNLNDETYATVGRKLGVDARTIKKYADMEDFKKKKKYRRTSIIIH